MSRSPKPSGTSSASTSTKLSDRPTLLSLTLAAGGGRFLADERGRVTLDGLQRHCSLGVDPGRLRGSSVMIATSHQRPAILAALALDGVASRILLCPPDILPGHLPAIMAAGAVDAVVADGAELAGAPAGIPVFPCGDVPTDATRPVTGVDIGPTEWVLFTSGTTGRPKLVRHTMASLIGPLDDGLARPTGAVWSTFYDVRRYGGLQILFRALLGGASMVLSASAEPVGEFLQRARRDGVTHMSGTPSHWRRALMSPFAAAMAPSYIRLSGEVADQAILDRLHKAFPHAGIAHAYASTEAGVAFDVRDGLAGFPASLLDRPGGAELRIEDGTLRIRSNRTASGYLGADMPAPGGFVDTGDMVERRGERCYFVGRREGVINVGGEKVYPEEVEAVINRHPSVQMSRVWARTNPVMGAIVAADLLLQPGAAAFETVREEVLDACRRAFPPHKVPVSVRQVPNLEIAGSGKMARRDA